MQSEIITATWIQEELKRITEAAARRTKCKRKGVGCGLYNLYEGRNELVVEMFNGPTRSGFQCTNVIGACGCIHSEPRCLMRAMTLGYQSGLIMFCTYSPCVPCANMIIESGLVAGVVREVFTKYPPPGDERGEQFLKDAGIDVVTLEQLKEFKGIEGGISDTLRRWKRTRPIS